jgi:hypothetical protein
MITARLGQVAFVAILISVLALLGSRSSSNSPASPARPGAAGSLSSSTSPLTTNCLTYVERYALCLQLRSNRNSSAPSAVDFFMARYNAMMAPDEETSAVATDVVLWRMHSQKWSEDLWLSTCALITEAASSRRHVFLYTRDGHEDSVPAEFRVFVRVHPETELNRTFAALPYDGVVRGQPRINGGYMHGDIAAGIFLRTNPQYLWCWIIECDVRFAGHWDWFFDTSLSSARAAKNYVPTAPNDGADDRGKEASLIWWYPRMLNYGYDHRWLTPAVRRDRSVAGTMLRTRLQKQWVRESRQLPVPENPATEIENVHVFARRNMFHSAVWQRALQKTVWASAFVPAMGVSRRLALLAYDLYLRGSGNQNQEVTLPVAAQLNGLKIVSLAGLQDLPSQFYFSYKADADEFKLPANAPLYMNWLRGGGSQGGATRNDTKLFGLWTAQFEGKKCLRNVVFHPVK